MFQTLFLNTFDSSTRVKWGISSKCNDTALSRRHPPSYSNSIVSLTLQNTLTKTSVQHFPITDEVVTDAFMLNTTHRNIPLPFSRPYTSINSRYTTICQFQDGVAIRVTQKVGLLYVFANSLAICLNDFYMCSITYTLSLRIQRSKKVELYWYMHMYIQKLAPLVNSYYNVNILTKTTIKISSDLLSNNIRQHTILLK